MAERNHTARYHAGNAEAAPDGRLFAKVFERNAPPIIAALVPWLAGRNGTVLEIGSGTGQHVGAFALAFPHLTWQPSDPFEDHRTSTRAWASHLRLSAPDPIDLDAASDWAAASPVQAMAPVEAIISLNVIHIAPIAVLDGIVAGAGKVLSPGGLLMFYGPFRINGAHISEGNARFDATLRADTPDWGVRDITEIEDRATRVGLELAEAVPMPSNNRLVVLRRV